MIVMRSLSPAKVLAHTRGPMLWRLAWAGGVTLLAATLGPEQAVSVSRDLVNRQIAFPLALAYNYALFRLRHLQRATCPQASGSVRFNRSIRPSRCW